MRGEEKGCACGKSACEEDGAGMVKKMAQVKLACRPASARLNTVRCDGGMTPFFHHTGIDLELRKKAKGERRGAKRGTK